MVLVTGGTGFIGAYIIKHLVEKGVAVRAIRRSSKLPFFIDPLLLQQVEWVEGDVLDIDSLQDAMQGIDAVIHAAAVVSFSKKNRQLMYQTNIDGTRYVVDVALENNIRRFIHVSSVAALGRTANNEKVTEEKKWVLTKSNTHYAITKYTAELEVWRAFAEGMEGVIVNPSTVLGFGDWHQSSSAIFKNVYKEFPWYTEGINGFVGVEDVAAAVVQLLQTSITDKRFIINADNWSFQKLFDTMADEFGKRKPYRKATPFLGELAWRLEKFKYLFTDGKPLLTRESARVAHSKTQFDNTALLNALPQFSFTPLTTVVQEACEKYTKAMQQGIITL
ncbi:MAG TPA: NAD-dependent epimerase/dehydratase family protein [Flavisolibacter sp.]|jgi:nucleoside-diphosphate-sugar epimerase|nr:NAD-dependent epimerase/dehydratase family protein [Flavisolibacter sp.]